MLELKTNWVLSFTPEEMRLVLKALGGRLNTDDERTAAMALGDELTRQRTQKSEQLFLQLKHNSDQIKKDDKS